MNLLQGKTALITGASKGIGKAIAYRYAEEGANVAFTYLSSVEQGLALEGELVAKGVKAKGYRSDASDFSQAENLINGVIPVLALSSQHPTIDLNHLPRNVRRHVGSQKNTGICYILWSASSFAGYSY